MSLPESRRSVEKVCANVQSRENTNSLRVWCEPCKLCPVVALKSRLTSGPAETAVACAGLVGRAGSVAASCSSVPGVTLNTRRVYGV